MPTRIFHRSELEEMGVPDECTHPGALNSNGLAVELANEQIDTRRWVSRHRLIFQAPDDGKAYAVFYERGLTEMQEDHDEWDDRDHIVGDEMEEHEVTVKRWRKVAGA